MDNMEDEQKKQSEPIAMGCTDQDKESLMKEGSDSHIETSNSS